MALTGRFNFRKTLTGKCVLQLEEDVSGVVAPEADEKEMARRQPD